MVQRCLKRAETSGRSDDNAETIRREFKTTSILHTLLLNITKNSVKFVKLTQQAESVMFTDKPKRPFFLKPCLSLAQSPPERHSLLPTLQREPTWTWSTSMNGSSRKAFKTLMTRQLAWLSSQYFPKKLSPELSWKTSHRMLFKPNSSSETARARQMSSHLTALLKFAKKECHLLDKDNLATSHQPSCHRKSRSTINLPKSSFHSWSHPPILSQSTLISLSRRLCRMWMIKLSQPSSILDQELTQTTSGKRSPRSSQLAMNG